jgi:hypothetical protein
MNAPKMQVKCSVENCKHNLGRMCHAGDLEVNAMGDQHAQTSDGTCCTTFINKQ